MVAVTYRGTVKNNKVVLERGVTLPDGAEVEVRLLESKPDSAKRKAAVARLRAIGEKLKGRDVNLSKYVIEAREELEKRV